MQSPPAPPPLQPDTQKCGYCARELPLEELVPRDVSPDPSISPLSHSRCTICWLLEDLDHDWTVTFGRVPREVMDAFAERLGTALEELRSFRAAPPGWAAPAATSPSTQAAEDESVR